MPVFDSHGTRPDASARAGRVSAYARAVCDAALEVLSPTRCAGCEQPGALICEACLSRIEVIDPVHSCTRCGAPFGDMLCTECGASTGSDAAEAPRREPEDVPGLVLAATVFKDPVPRIIRSYKDAGEQRVGELIAELMFDAAEHAEQAAPQRYGGLLGSADAVTFVPVTASAYARRGFDHMELIARSFSELSGLPLVDALAKHGSSDQRAYGRAERQEHARSVYEVVVPVDGMRLLLLDDVITTGATVRAAASALRAAGAARVDVLAFARVW